MGKVGLGTTGASDFPLCCAVVLEVTVTVFGARMERMVVFFCGEKGFGVSRGLVAGAGLGFVMPPVWEASTELSITVSLKEKGTYSDAAC